MGDPGQRIYKVYLKFILFIFGLLISPSFYAADQLMAGPYLGIDRSVMAIHENYTQSAPTTTTVSPSSAIKINDTFWADHISLVGGFGKKTKTNYYYGGEIGTDIYFDSDRTLKNTTLSYHYNMTLSALIGHYVGKNMLIYGRLGIVMSELGVQYTGQTTPNSTEQSGNNTAKALKMGLGVQYLLYKHLSLRAEFNYLTYQKLDIALYPQNYNAKLSLTGQQITIGVLYTF